MIAHKDFTSDSFKNFKFFHIELNSYIKLSVSAIDYLSDKSRDPKDLTNLIGNLIASAGERWTPSNYEDPFMELNKLRSQLTQSAIMWVFSSFEVFLNHVHSSCAIVIEDDVEKNERSERIESIRLVELFKKFKWKLDDLNYLIPAFDFYGLSRHCIVHNMGKASQELKKMSLDKAFIDSIAKWPTVIENRKLSPPPVINDDGSIEFNPHHAITYSDICFRIAKKVNENILNVLGIDFYLNKIVKKDLLEKNELLNPACSHLYAYLNFHLKKEYNFDTMETNEIKDILEKKEILKKSNQKYLELKNKKNLQVSKKK